MKLEEFYKEYPHQGGFIELTYSVNGKIACPHCEAKHEVEFHIMEAEGEEVYSQCGECGLVFKWWWYHTAIDFETEEVDA